MTLERIIWVALCGAIALVVGFVKITYKDLKKKVDEVDESTNEITTNYIQRFWKLEVLIANTEKTIVQTINDKFETLRGDMDKKFVSKEVFDTYKNNR